MAFVRTPPKNLRNPQGEPPPHSPHNQNTRGGRVPPSIAKHGVDAVGKAAHHPSAAHALRRSGRHGRDILVSRMNGGGLVGFDSEAVLAHRTWRMRRDSDKRQGVGGCIRLGIITLHQEQDTPGEMAMRTDWTKQQPGMRPSLPHDQVGEG
jgi:hypothetical protein